MRAGSKKRVMTKRIMFLQLNKAANWLPQEETDNTEDQAPVDEGMAGKVQVAGG